MKIYVEFGYGNNSLINSEIEYEEGREERYKGVVIGGVLKDMYIRLWVGEYMYILSIKDGFKVKRKDRKMFKLVVGLMFVIN